METTINEIADGIYRLSTFVPDVGPTGFTFNQFVIDDDEPLLFHTGSRGMFPLVSDAVAKVVPLDRLRWITFGHLESDECGAMNLFLAAAPAAQIAHGGLGCMVSLNDLADRMPMPMEDGQVIELGRHRVRHIDTPHVPHGWDARVLFEETTGTLFCGDLLSQVGDVPALTSDDVAGAAVSAEDMFQASSITPKSAPTVRRLADLSPTTLAIMHGSSFTGDCATQLHALADDFDSRLNGAR
ncbi:MAG TPA: MBL fold metallo-hydrolase [Ilumatobacteraceae bacterium]|nr:MBL fold metallo-hydrolase [Ilumatobacteraceae bacterium]